MLAKEISKKLTILKDLDFTNFHKTIILNKEITLEKDLDEFFQQIS